MPSKETESKILARILKAAQLQPELWVERQNVGAIKMGSRFVRFGAPGMADITGQLKDGTRIEIEVKTPSGKQTEHQKAFQTKVELFGGIYLLVRSLDEFLEQLDDVLKARNLR